MDGNGVDPFLIQGKDKIELNPKVIKAFNNATDPHIILFYGPTRIGKSTTLNNLINGPGNKNKFKTEIIFQAESQHKSCTIGCNIFGPVKLSTIKNRLGINEKCSKDNSDIFFADSEGFGSINGKSDFLVPGILTLLQVCSVTCCFSSNVLKTEIVEDIINKKKFTDFLKQIRNFRPPNTVLFLTGQTKVEKSFEQTREYLETIEIDAKDQLAELIDKEKLDSAILGNIEPSVCGLFRDTDEEMPNENIELKTYWHFLRKLFEKFVMQIQARKAQSGNDLVSLTEILFNFFIEANIKMEFSDNLEEIFQKTLKLQFNKEIANCSKIIYPNLEYDLEKCFKISRSSEDAKKLILSIIPKEKIEIYQRAIASHVNETQSNLALEISKKALEIIDNQKSRFFSSLTSDESIDKMIKKITDHINSKVYIEDIDQSLFNDQQIQKNCDLKLSENKKTYEFMKIYYKDDLENAINSMKSKIHIRINTLLKTKTKWESYAEENLKSIEKSVQNSLINAKNSSQFKEDFLKQYPNSDSFYKTNVKELFDKKFTLKIDEKRQNEIKAKIKKIIETIYNNLGISSMESWEKRRNSIQNKIKSEVENYINKLFENKKSPNEVDTKNGNAQSIELFIKTRFSIDENISSERKNEIESIITNISLEYSSIFDKKRNELVNSYQQQEAKRKKQEEERKKQEEERKRQEEERKRQEEERRRQEEERRRQEEERRRQEERRLYLNKMAREVFEGKWGNYPHRTPNLINAGHNAKEIQDRINEYYKRAEEVWDGKHGNGEERKKKIIGMGYDYDLLQKIVGVTKPKH